MPLEDKAKAKSSRVPVGSILNGPEVDESTSAMPFAASMSGYFGLINLY
jgi:hypothetical protein